MVTPCFFCGGRPGEEKWVPVRKIIPMQRTTTTKTNNKAFGTVLGLVSFRLIRIRVKCIAIRSQKFYVAHKEIYYNKQ